MRTARRITLVFLVCRAAFLAALVVVALAFLAGSAHAGDPQRAKEMFQQGSVYFDLGQFDKAIDIWQRGYEEKQDPGFLFNIAQAYRLSNDPRKAVFFYKSFLRNSPNAPNRREIEQRIAAQEKLYSTEEHAKPGPPPSTGATDAQPSSPTPVPPPPAPVDTAPPIAPVSASPPPPPPPPVPAPRSESMPPSPPVAATTVDASTGSSPNRRFDIGAALGGNAWISGVRGTATPSLSVAATFGYTFGDANAGRTRFRLGGLLGYTFLSDVGARATFFSALIDPGVRIRMAEQWTLAADLGVGVLAIAGLGGASALLAPQTPVMVNGTQSVIEVRPGIGIEYWLRPGLAVVGGTAIAYSPKRAYFYAPLARLDLLLGLVVRL